MATDDDEDTAATSSARSRSTTASGRASRKQRVAGTGAPLKTWAVRALLALVAGASLGAGAGVMTVNRFEPGRGTGVDSLAVMLDSIARGRVPEPQYDSAATKNEDSASEDAEAGAPSAAVAPELVVVPTLVGLGEGAARNALLDAGLQVGEIQFQSSPRPAGTVLSTSPETGTKVAPDTPVSLVLSDGRPDPVSVSETDSLAPFPTDSLHR